MWHVGTHCLEEVLGSLGKVLITTLCWSWWVQANSQNMLASILPGWRHVARFCWLFRVLGFSGGVLASSHSWGWSPDTILYLSCLVGWTVMTHLLPADSGWGLVNTWCWPLGLGEWEWLGHICFHPLWGEAWSPHCLIWIFLKNRILIWTATLLLGIYPINTKTLIGNCICTPMFMVVLCSKDLETTQVCMTVK